MEEIKVRIDDKEHIVKVEGDESGLKIHLDGKVYNVETSLKAEQSDFETKKKGSDDSLSGIVKATLPGIIFSVDVKKGQKVKKGHKLVSLIAMKMENQVLAPISGTVKEVNIKKNDKVNKGDILLVIE